MGKVYKVTQESRFYFICFILSKIKSYSSVEEKLQQIFFGSCQNSEFLTFQLILANYFLCIKYWQGVSYWDLICLLLL